MLISHNEIEATCKKVFEGMGFAAGEDEAAAVSVAWLALHGLPILATFAEELDHVSGKVGCVPRLVEETADFVSFDCDNCCSLITGTPALGYAFAKAMQAERVTCVIHNVNLPELLLPQLVSFAKHGVCVELVWADRVAVIHAGEQYPMLGERGEERKTADTTITFQREPFACEQPTMKTVEFATAYKHHCRHGIVVDDTVWQKYITLSKAVLVPETEASRLRGAGEDAA